MGDPRTDGEEARADVERPVAQSPTSVESGSDTEDVLEPVTRGSEGGLPGDVGRGDEELH